MVLFSQDTYTQIIPEETRVVHSKIYCCLLTRNTLNARICGNEIFQI